MEDAVQQSGILMQIPKHQSTPKEPMDRSERRSLQTLQASPTGTGLNGGKESIKDKNRSILDGHKEHFRGQPKNLTIYEDVHLADSNSSVHCSRGTQTDKSLSKHQHSWSVEVEELQENGGDSAYFDQEAFDLMANENIPEFYWKDLAEERRRALEESLEENRRLSIEVSQLKEENSRLSDVAQEAKQLKELLEGVLSDDEDSAIKSEVSTEAEHSREKCAGEEQVSPKNEAGPQKKTEGKVDRSRGRGRQRKSWTTNIAEMTNMRVNAAAKAATEREGWRSMASNLFKEIEPS
ncbi:geminin-like [Elysia marginata]|uniref:Geminin-like n=1 Tax=Elysia marginata TaxID=1093978 RepID=A0AAV4FL83_9GAST|nr:geminin-like [Elysia marginata]